MTTTGQRHWDSATYSCLSGYELVGETIRVCQDTGQWSLTAPICVGKYQLLFINGELSLSSSFLVISFLAVDCGALKPPSDGQVFFQSTLFLSEATYSCNSGFELVGEATRTCQANGQWSGEEPQCQRA